MIKVKQKAVIMVLVLIFLTGIPVLAEEDGFTLEKAMELALANDQNLEQAQMELAARKSTVNAYENRFENNYTIMVNNKFALREDNSLLTEDTIVNSQLNVNWLISPEASFGISQELAGYSDGLYLLGNGSARYTYDLMKNYDSKTDSQRTLELARIAVEEQEGIVSNLRAEIRYSVIAAYYDLMKLEEQVKNQEALVGQSRNTCAIARARVEAGEASRLDLAEAELQVEKNEVALETLNLNLEQARDRLEELTGMEVPEEPHLARVDELRELQFTKEELERMILDNDNTLQITRKTIELQGTLIANLSQKDLPELQLYGQVSWARDEALPAEVMVGFDLNYQYGTYQEQADEQLIVDEKLKLQSLENSLQSRKDNLVSALEQALLSLEQLKEQISLSRKSIGLLERSLEVARVRYEAGLTNISEVMAKELQLSNERSSLVQLIIDHNLQVYQIEKMAGIL